MVRLSTLHLSIISSPSGLLCGLLLCLSTCCTLSVGFNIDTDFPIRFAIDQPRSYFGFSVAMLSNSRGNWIIVSAPKANSSRIPTLTEPGEIFACQIESKNCTPVEFETKGNEKYEPEPSTSYLERRDGSWLGVSLDTTQVKQGRVLACSHLWVNAIYQNYYLTNGACYTIDKEFDQMSVQKITPVVDMKDQILRNNDYKYAYAQVGTSAQFLKGSDSFILGGPGIFDWKGSSIFMSRGHSGNIQKRDTVGGYGTEAQPDPLSDLDFGAYFGYAVTSGRFLNSNDVQYVVGAPRQSYKGKVYILEVKNNMYQERLARLGEQMGEYFGSTVCAVDLDNDQLDDLLVGAPLYSKQSDEGRVYVFMNKGNTIFQLSTTLMGSSIPGARFGSSIAVLGDINMDNYLDVAIGAPYENGQGAVYIYHGSSKGLQSTFQQKITAERGSPLAKGFGISISRGMDADNNSYNDLVVGSYLSSDAFVFRTKPLVYLTGELNTDRLQINMDNKDCGPPNAKVSCFKLSACITYTGKFVPDSINVNYTIEMDTMKSEDINMVRVFLIAPNGQRLQEIQDVVSIKLNDRFCANYEVHAPDIPRDYLTPIMIGFKYEMIPVRSPDPGFCKTCPVIDQSRPNKITKQIRFQKHCGDDQKCDADLQLQASVRNLGADGIFVIGSQSKIVVHAKLLNAEEPAYASMLVFDLPTWISVGQKPPSCDFTQNVIKTSSRLVCLVANPLRPNTSVDLDISLNVERIPLENGVFDVNITALTDSTEDPAKLHDNTVLIQIPAKLESDVYIYGSTPEEQAFYEQDSKGKVAENATVYFTHRYEVYNAGPSPVTFLTLVVNYPMHDLATNTRILQITNIDKKEGAKTIFGSCQAQIFTVPGSPSVQLSPGVDLVTQPEQRRRRDVAADSNELRYDALNNDSSITPAVPKESFVLNCTTGVCANVTCVAGPFEKDTRATLVITYITHVFNLTAANGGKDSTLIQTDARAFLSSSLSDPQWKDHKPIYGKVVTEVKPGGPPPPKEMAPWIIPVSVIGGLLILILLIVALIKLGFFRRKKKEEMERLKQNEQTSEQDGTLLEN